MSFIVQMGNSGDVNTEAVFGATEDFKPFYLDLDQAPATQQKICTDFFALVGGHVTVNILNSAHNFEDCNYVVVSGVETDVVDVDYSALSNINKGKINAFANLLVSIAQ
jgi:hypothetical protein